MKLRSLILICILSLGAAAQTKVIETGRTRTEPLNAGETAPDFTLFDQTGRELKLSKVKKNVMLVFYRGYW